MDRESFIGLWDMYHGRMHSELLLQADGTYHHSLMGGVQTHWGAWTLGVQAGQPALLVLELHGAEPAVYNGPLGPIRINWPNSESWAVLTVQPNQITFFNGLMSRRAFVEFPAGDAAQTQSLPTPFPVPPQAPPANFPPIQYSAPAFPAPPMGHAAGVIGNWQQISDDAMKAWQDGLSALKARTQIGVDAMKNFTDIQDMQRAEFNRGVAQRAASEQTFEDNMHQQAQNFISKI